MYASFTIDYFEHTIFDKIILRKVYFEVLDYRKLTFTFTHYCNIALLFQSEIHV